MFNANAFDYFKEGVTEPYTIVCIAETSETKKSSLDLPLSWCRFLNPMSSNCKVTINIAGLPCVTC